VPATLTARERALFEELKRESKFDPRATVATEATHGH
jgi:curved DNA-binding protein